MLKMRCLFLGSLLTAAALFADAAHGAPPPRPRLDVEPAGGSSRIFVTVDNPGGQTRRSLLRVTPATVQPGASGWDPAGRAAFATWNENGERWFSAARDGGQTWSEPRPIRMGLQLHAGDFPPGRPLPGVPDSLALPAGGRLFLVQFRTLGLPEWRDALRDLGAEVLSHVPYNAHVVRMRPELVPVVAALDIVERVEPFHPYHRIDPDLRDWLTGAAEPSRLRVRAVAAEWGPEAKERIRQAAEAEGATVPLYWPSGHVLELEADRQQLRRIAAHDDVLWIDPWSEPETDMNVVRQDSGANFVEINHGVCGQGVRGEVMDSGIEATHIDFDGLLLHTPANVTQHGTSTYGILFGNGNRDGDGDSRATGQLICGSQGIFADYNEVFDRFFHTLQLKRAPYFASFQSNSWGHRLTLRYDSFAAELDDIAWRLDFAIAQSQSNAGDRRSRPEAWGKNVISVGGINHRNTLSPADDAWAGDASIGPAADGRIKPDLHYWYDGIYTTTLNNGYATFGGTSAATPTAAGVLGLIVQMWSDNVWGTNPQGTTVFERQPHLGTLKALLVNSAQQYFFEGERHDLARVHQGWGRPNARIARERAAGSLAVDQTVPLQLGQSAGWDVTVPPGALDLKVSMAYPDPPGTTAARLHRINDLDLRVISPSGTIYWGNNGLLEGIWSVAGGEPNTADTVENVFVQYPQAGAWRVEVRAAEINQDAHLSTPEPDAVFGLVATTGIGEAAVCGNGVRQEFEACDGADLGGLNCSALGYAGGTLACDSGCALDTSGCVCKQAGAFCTANAQCCSGVCSGGLFFGTVCR